MDCAERGTSTLLLVDQGPGRPMGERIERFLGIRAGQLGAAAYEQSVKRIAAQFWLGLTATPTRRDGLGQLVTWQLGPVRHSATEENHGTIAAALDFDAGPQRLLRIHETTFEVADVDLDAPGALAEVHRLLAVDEQWNTQIADDVTAALTQGWNCLVLTRRVAHVEALTAILTNRGHQALVLQGSMNRTDRRAAVDRLGDAKSGDGLLVIGTTPFIGEGFDAPALDTLFRAGPISYDGLLIQCAGRVIRAAPGKDVAEVHDYHDPGQRRSSPSLSNAACPATEWALWKLATNAEALSPRWLRISLHDRAVAIATRYGRS
jgi:superfamily II DNA or RNA helicase